MLFNHLLIATELGSMIATHTLVPISGIVFIERIRCQVQYTIVQSLILQNQLIGFCLTEALSLYLFFYKLLIVQIALVHVPHIYQTEHSQSSDQRHLLQFAHAICPDQAGTHQDNEETTPSIRSKETHAHFFQVGQQRHQLVGRNTLESIHFHGRYIRREEHLRKNGKQQCQTTCQSEADHKILLALLNNSRSIHHLLQCQHRQQRNGKFGHHQDGRNGTELIVHRHIVDKEIGETHEILTPRKKDRKNSSRQKCPFHRTFYDEKA